MDIRTASADFSAPLRGSGPRTASQAVIFPRPVDRVAVGIVGYSVAFGDHSDHAVGRVQIQVESTISDNVVTVTATLGLRDFSGSWDDDYQGTVDFAVLADLAPAGSPRPREDMLIVDMEVNQAVQFFRAARFLDGATVLPDNAIVLVENKTTGFRCYVDYDAFAGLPPVATLTGEMTVRTGSTTFTRTPINGGGGIVPMADAAINQASADNTLNFMLEGAWCVGTVTVSVQVWDAADPLTKSAVFTRTLNFHPVAPLDIFVVGVHYTAQSLDLPAPGQADIVNAMGRLRSTYPVGDVSINGYSTLDFNEDVNYTITASGGCGDGMSHLLNKLDDMKGGSSDIYAGFLPDLALIRTPRSNIGGCGQVGQGAIFIDQTGDSRTRSATRWGVTTRPAAPAAAIRRRRTSTAITRSTAPFPPAALACSDSTRRATPYSIRRRLPTSWPTGVRSGSAHIPTWRSGAPSHRPEAAAAPVSLTGTRWAMSPSRP
jgi:hypothetical protein